MSSVVDLHLLQRTFFLITLHESIRIDRLPLKPLLFESFFAEKFSREHIQGCLYENFPLENISQFPELWKQQPDLKGINVTIPYKQEVIPFLDELSAAVKEIGAVNCVRLGEDGKLKGFNTDVIGFRRSLEPLLQPHHNKALVLGTGGAAKAVKFVLKELGIGFKEVSRNATDTAIAYESLTPAMMEEYTLIINTTPLGMYPKVDTAPPIPYEYITDRHLLYDLVYNPAVPLFLEKGAAKGAVIKNGHEMLILQAEASWEIWNS
ncbi:shikimate dehydrogenase [Chitinophaga horti]|uniref:Shikimate dehydrogenase n=1 Tax=Chitinophaga horti TaxID=2920382 RepID=A0ABY6J235_9BACT|nr:shikimate dehydrogenase [Chitinophaga horti]UYQ93739.1 shikimate dehydrogenase [Chitinophaga horti]